jgi:hypothetical protein
LCLPVRFPQQTMYAALLSTVRATYRDQYLLIWLLEYCLVRGTDNENRQCACRIRKDGSPTRNNGLRIFVLLKDKQLWAWNIWYFICNINRKEPRLQSKSDGTVSSCVDTFRK